MNRWTYSTKEVSAGCYECEAIRDTHHSISAKGFESEIPKLLRDSFRMEMSMGTSPGESLFHVTKGFKSSWSATFDERIFGSWIVTDKRTKSSVIFEGKDSYIEMVFDPPSPKPPFWTGPISKLLGTDWSYFERLLYFY